MVKLRRDDMVKVLLGKDRGKKAKILSVLPDKGRVLVEGVNMVKKHVKPKRAGEKGQRVVVAAPINVSNVQLICPSCKKATRVGITRSDGQRKRICKKCKAEIG